MIVKKIFAFPIHSFREKIEIIHRNRGVCARPEQIRSYIDFNPFRSEK